MRHIVAATRVFALSLVLVIFTMHAEAKAQSPDRNLSFRELASLLHTPEDITHYLWRYFAFESDRRQFGSDEHWQTPEEFLASGKGDCEDFAVFAKEILKQNGIPAFLLNIYGPHYAHTVCVYTEGGRYNLIDGANLVHLEAGSLREVTSYLYPFWETGAIVAPAKETKQGRILAEFERRLETQRLLATSA